MRAMGQPCNTSRQTATTRRGCCPEGRPLERTAILARADGSSLDEPRSQAGVSGNSGRQTSRRRFPSKQLPRMSG
jgi:hypothetical protein